MTTGPIAHPAGGAPARSLACIAFTERGLALAGRAARALEASAGWAVTVSAGTGTGRVRLADWTAEHFDAADALLFVGSTGIAVRAIAPHVRSKASDPAVLVMDECGTWLVSLLSGHIGGANRLARSLAGACGATPVLTTATDARGLWAVDDWATVRGLAIDDVHAIKGVSAKLLAGHVVRLYSDVELVGPLPAGVERETDVGDADVVISPWARPEARDGSLWLVPRCLVLGMGCRRGISASACERAWAQASSDLASQGLVPDERAIAGVRSIDLKAHEEGLLAFCAAHGWELETYPAQTLARVSGVVAAPSAFVSSVTGVDNVCERSALVDGGRVVWPKHALDGVTVALVQGDLSLGFAEPCPGA